MSGAHIAFRDEERLLDIDDMRRWFGLSREAIYNRRHRGDFPPATMIGASLRWRAGDVDAWLNERREVV